MESAYNAVASDESATIHNVNIKWQEQGTCSGTLYTGSFTLPLHFCHSRQLKFSGVVSVEEEPWEEEDADEKKKPLDDR